MTTENEGSKEPDSIRRILGFLLLAAALVILPSQLTSTRVEVKTPNIEISLGQIEPSANATSFQDLIAQPDTPIVVPEPVPEPPQAVVEPEVIPTPPPVIEEPVAPSKPVSKPITGNKAEWLAASGIPESEWANVDWLISKESGWNPCSYNPGKSDCSLTAAQVNATKGKGVACGLAQSLPCGKWGADWTDPVNQLRQAHIYVTGRYKGWAGAKNHSLSKGWY